MTRASRSLLALALASVSLHASAAFDDWSLTGDATLIDEGATLRLTQTLDFQSGSGFAPFLLDLTSDFSLFFSFRISGNDPAPADGIALVLRNPDTAALAEAGGGLGYQGIGSSLAFLFDTYDNGFETDGSGDNLSWAFDGNLIDPHGELVSFEVPDDVNGGSLRNALINGWLDLDADIQVFSLYLSTAFEKPLDPVFSVDSYPIDADDFSQVLVGFTAATGTFSDFHDILNFQVVSGNTTPLAPVPLPGALVCMGTALASLAAAGGKRRATGG